MPPAATPPEDKSTPAVETAPTAVVLPTPEGKWTPPSRHVGDLPAGEAEVRIDGLGVLTFDAGQVATVRPDIFQPGHFSLFDILVHLDEKGDLDLAYHFDESADTHVIETINGQRDWWYEAHYSAGWFESSAWRMDAYPYKNDMRIRVSKGREDRLAAIHRTHQEEVQRLASNGGQVIIPDLRIRSPYGSWSFEDVLATPHDLRTDALQPGLVTALDALISLAERGEIESLGLTWYERIGSADPVDSYWVSRVNDAEAYGGCGFVYETGPQDFGGFSGTHIHIPADMRVLVSPEYALWFWICL
jgi:hypothetical protein